MSGDRWIPSPPRRLIVLGPQAGDRGSASSARSSRRLLDRLEGARRTLDGGPCPRVLARPTGAHLASWHVEPAGATSVELERGTTRDGTADELVLTLASHQPDAGRFPWAGDPGLRIEGVVPGSPVLPLPPREGNSGPDASLDTARTMLRLAEACVATLERSPPVDGRYPFGTALAAAALRAVDRAGIRLDPTRCVASFATPWCPARVLGFDGARERVILPVPEMDDTTRLVMVLPAGDQLRVAPAWMVLRLDADPVARLRDETTLERRPRVEPGDPFAPDSDGGAA